MKIYLIRHGESTANAGNLFCGHSDVPLTEAGIEQASLAHDKLKKIRFGKVYSSDLSRAYETAGIISKKPKKIVVCSELREMDFGIFDSLSHADMKANHPEEYREWSSDFLNNVPPGGESMISMYSRVNEKYREIVEKHLGTDDNILLVSHGGVIRSILASQICSGVDSYWKFKIDNCGINILEYDKEFPFLAQLNG
jgi:alpha-ribazole phosphatase